MMAGARSVAVGLKSVPAADRIVRVKRKVRRKNTSVCRCGRREGKMEAFSWSLTGSDEGSAWPKKTGVGRIILVPAVVYGAC